MKVAILQSNYIPWKGYFDLINSAELFIFHDDLQYTKNDWRNRNKIKTPAGPKWLSIPCGTDEKRLICEVEPVDHKWQRKHWQQILQNYSKAPNFKQYKEFFEEFYLGREWNNLSELNQYLVRAISKDFLGSTTEFADSRTYGLESRKAERVMELLQKVGATEYISGPAAQDYLDPQDFDDAGIKLTWMDYSGYPEYPQNFPPFKHNVSVIDLLFNVGADAPSYMKSF